MCASRDDIRVVSLQVVWPMYACMLHAKFLYIKKGKESKNKKVFTLENDFLEQQTVSGLLTADRLPVTSNTTIVSFRLEF